jgi:hypothetical protein
MLAPLPREMAMSSVFFDTHAMNPPSAFFFSVSVFLTATNPSLAW